MRKEVVCRDINGNPTEPVPVGKLSFRPSVYGVIIKNQKVLLVPQWDGYDFPGGGIEVGETIDEGLAREVREETGLTVKRKEIIAAEDDFFKPPYSGKYFHTILIYYLCDIVSGEISDKGFDEEEKKYAKKAQWIDIGRVDKLKFYNPVDSPSIVRKALSLYKEGQMTRFVTSPATKD